MNLLDSSKYHSVFLIHRQTGRAVGTKFRIINCCRILATSRPTSTTMLQLSHRTIIITGRYSQTLAPITHSNDYNTILRFLYLVVGTSRVAGTCLRNYSRNSNSTYRYSQFWIRTEIRIGNRLRISKTLVPHTSTRSKLIIITVAV